MGLLRALLGQPDSKKPAEQASAAQESFFNSRLNEIKADNDRQFKRLTMIFSALAGILAVTAITIIALSIYARIQGNQAVRESRADVERAIQEMNRKFELLAGDSLDGPRLEVTTATGNLDGAVIYIDKEQTETLIPAVSVANVGEKRTDTVNVRILFSEKVSSVASRSKDTSSLGWQTDSSADPLFPSAFSLKNPYLDGIDSKASWPLGEIVVRFPHQPSAVYCKLLIDFGAEEPAKADFMLVCK